MNRRTLFFLFAAAVVLIAISLLMPSPVEKNGSEELLIPGLKEKLNDVLNAICDGAKTGEIGDGKIFIYDLDDVIRIRTGERGKEAL